MAPNGYYNKSCIHQVVFLFLDLLKSMLGKKVQTYKSSHMLVWCWFYLKESTSKQIQDDLVVATQRSVTLFYSWWWNQPLWNICASRQIGSWNPESSGWKIPKNIWVAITYFLLAGPSLSKAFPQGSRSWLLFIPWGWINRTLVISPGDLNYWFWWVYECR